MPEPTFGPDKCQEDKCLNPQVQAFVHRGICPLQAFVLRGICPTGGQMPVQAFVLPGICLSRHLSANRKVDCILPQVVNGSTRHPSIVEQEDFDVVANFLETWVKGY